MLTRFSRHSSGPVFIKTENAVKERERKPDSLQRDDSGNWLYEKKISVVVHSAYTISGIRLQHRKLDFGMKIKNMNEQVNIYRHIHFNSQVKAGEKSLGVD